MRIQITPDELLACAQRFQLASGSLQELGTDLRNALNGVDWETRQSVNVEGYVGAALSKLNALSQISDSIAGFLSHKADAFSTVDAYGGGEISAEARTLIESPAPRPDWAVWKAAEAEAKAFLAPGGLLRDPAEDDGWSFTRLVRAAWKQTAEVVTNVLENPWVSGALNAVQTAAGFFSIYEGWTIGAAGIALLATGPVGIVIGAGALLLGGALLVQGAGDVAEGVTGLTSRAGYGRAINPVRELYKRLLGDSTGETVYNSISVATFALSLAGSGARILAKATSRTTVKATEIAETTAAGAARKAGDAAAREAAERFPSPSVRKGTPKRVRRAVVEERQGAVRSARNSAARKAYETAYNKVTNEKVFNPDKYHWRWLEQARESLAGKAIEYIDGGKNIWGLGGSLGVVPKASES